MAIFLTYDEVILHALSLIKYTVLTHAKDILEQPLLDDESKIAPGLPIWCIGRPSLAILDSFCGPELREFCLGVFKGGATNFPTGG